MKVVSLFSGAGGLDLGFIWAGHTIVWANDLFEDAVKTYRLNIGDHIVLNNIYDVQSDNIPDCDIVIGGFPCQGFSVANTGRHEDDERNKLYLEMIRVIKDKSPKFFLAENVKGILSIGKGQVFNNILNDFSSLGYRVSYQLVNSADYGVPQRRQRVLIVGVRNDIPFQFQFPIPTHSKEADLLRQPWVTVNDAIGGLPAPDTPNDLLNHVYSKFKIKFNGYIGHRPVDPNLPAPTVTARGDDKGGTVILPHPNGTRRMTCRELALIQSFPIDFKFVGGIASVCRQIGNAVPPLLAKQVALMFNKYESL